MFKSYNYSVINTSTDRAYMLCRHTPLNMAEAIECVGLIPTSMAGEKMIQHIVNEGVTFSPVSTFSNRLYQDLATDTLQLHIEEQIMQEALAEDIVRGMGIKLGKRRVRIRNRNG